MKRFMKNLVTCLFLLGCLLNASAENLIYPPENAEQEAWIMTYNQYDYQNYHPILDSKKRNVKIVRDQDQMYIMGIFPEFPDCWIKGTVSGNNLIFDNCQTICIIDNNPIYFRCGYMLTYIEGKMYSYQLGGFSFEYGRNEPIFTISDDGNSIQSYPSLDEIRYPFLNICRTAFWYSTDTGWSDIVDYIQNYCDDWFYSSSPILSYPVDISFAKDETGGISSLNSDSNIHSDAVYNLHGNIMNTDNLAPGIYIRNGKKFIIK